MNADQGLFSYNQQVFGPRDRATRHLDVGLPQTFAERREPLLYALQYLSVRNLIACSVWTMYYHGTVYRPTCLSGVV